MISLSSLVELEHFNYHFLVLLVVCDRIRVRENSTELVRSVCLVLVLTPVDWFGATTHICFVYGHKQYLRG